MTRAENGQFVKGESGNPNGRPKKERSEKYYQILVTAVSPEDWLAICAKARDQAKRGDAVARKFLADYLIGRPVQRDELTGLDGGKLQIEVIYPEDTADPSE